MSVELWLGEHMETERLMLSLREDCLLLHLDKPPRLHTPKIFPHVVFQYLL
jgi:hypothetical protein